MTLTGKRRDGNRDVRPCQATYCGLEALTLTTMPPVGRGAVEGQGGGHVLTARHAGGERVRPVSSSCGGYTLRTADWLVPLKLAEMFPVVCAATAVVVMVKLAWVCPAVTVTVAGTLAAALALLRNTMTSAVEVALRVTRPLELLPPVTPAGASDRAVRVGPGRHSERRRTWSRCYTRRKW